MGEPRVDPGGWSGVELRNIKLALAPARNAGTACRGSCTIGVSCEPPQVKLERTRVRPRAQILRALGIAPGAAPCERAAEISLCMGDPDRCRNRLAGDERGPAMRLVVGSTASTPAGRPFAPRVPERVLSSAKRFDEQRFRR
jgi:hypothetical protein